MRLVPGALLGVVAGTVTALVLDMNVARVEVPDSILAAITPPTAFASWLTPEIIAAAIAVAFIASAETLLSAAAVDKMHRSAERREGQECVSPCNSRGSPDA